MTLLHARQSWLGGRGGGDCSEPGPPPSPPFQARDPSLSDSFLPLSLQLYFDQAAQDRVRYEKELAAHNHVTAG